MQTKLISLALSGLLALGITGAAFAQDTPPPPPPDQGQAGPPPEGGGRGMRMDPTRQLERMTRELNLTSDQQEKIKPLLVERQQKMQALMENQSLSQEDRRAQMRTIAEGTNNSIKANLNDDQKQKFDSMRQRMRRGGPGGPPADGAAPPPQPQL
jgi:Spy/CpxP family protein refolding chaperone